MSNDNVYEETVKLAYELYEKSGRVEGRDLDNWLEAERTLRTRYSEKLGNDGDAIKSNNMKHTGDEIKGYKRVIVNGIKSSASSSFYSEILNNTSFSREDRETTKRLEKESIVKQLLLLRENEKIYLTSFDLFEAELKMIEEELQKASEKINQNQVKLSEIAEEIYISNVHKNKRDYRNKFSVSISLLSLLIFIGISIWHFEPIAFLFGILFLGLFVYSAFNFFKSYKLKSFVSIKNQEKAKLIKDLGKLWEAESFCENQYNQKVDMIEKQRKEIEVIAAKISEVKSNLIALEEKEKLHYEILEQEDDNMSFEEKRKYERRHFVKPIKYSLQDIHSGKLALISGDGVSVDLGEGGIGMITDYALKRGNILFFEEKTKEEEIKINKITPIAAIVRWAKEFEHNKYRVGLAFRTV
jgi:hypothetical protein